MEPEFIAPFRKWLEDSGAYINPLIAFVKGTLADWSDILNRN